MKFKSLIYDFRIVLYKKNISKTIQFIYKYIKNEYCTYITKDEKLSIYLKLRIFHLIIKAMSVNLYTNLIM